jgi:hypothetical protein
MLHTKAKREPVGRRSIFDHSRSTVMMLTRTGERRRSGRCRRRILVLYHVFTEFVIDLTDRWGQRTTHVCTVKYILGRREFDSRSPNQPIATTEVMAVILTKPLIHTIVGTASQPVHRQRKKYSALLLHHFPRKMFTVMLITGLARIGREPPSHHKSNSTTFNSKSLTFS